MVGYNSVEYQVDLDIRLFHFKRRTNPYTLSSERSPERLYSNDSKDEPKEAHEKSNSDQKRGGFLQGPEDCLSSTLNAGETYRGSFSNAKQSKNSKTTQHLKYVYMMFQDSGYCEDQRNPVANDCNKIHSVE